MAGYAAFAVFGVVFFQFGVGIAQDKIGQIFDAFTQAEAGVPVLMISPGSRVMNWLR